MRKLISTLLLICCSFLLQAQTTVFSEDFENPPGNVTSSGTPGWFTCNRIQAGGVNCDSSAIVNAGDMSYLETNSFDCSFNFFVTLSFENICKLDFFDNGIIEYSIDGGGSWVQLIDNNGPLDNCVYMGTGLFSTQGSRFCEGSYAAWLPGQPVVPDNSWWRTETFDISAIAGGQSDVRLRFVTVDPTGNGGGGKSGWYVDDMSVVMSFCELIAPSVYGLPPAYPPTVYNLGPFPVNIAATDASGIGTVTLNYSIDGIAQTPIIMPNTIDSTYSDLIPAVDTFQVVCYNVTITDGSFCQNVSYFPGPTALDSVCFTVEGGITFPYCDNFDLATGLWTAQSPITGTAWELGTPAFGATTGAHSPPNSWDINLTTAYTNSATAYLKSPEFSFIPVGAGATLEFWHNYNAEGGWDGTRLEWTTDTTNGPWNVLMPFLQTDPNCVDCVNWYTDDQLNSSGVHAWEGNSGGWIKSSVVLDAQFNGLAQCWFRFVFTSDGSVIFDGYSIDDFCISLPQPEDVGVSAINQPGTSGPAGNCNDIIVTVKNYGLNTQNSFDVTYLMSNGATGTATYSGTLTPGATALFTFPACDTVPTGTYSICAWTSLPGDQNNFNDTTCINSIGIPVLVPTACDDFESGNLGFQTATNNAFAAEWQLGTPAFGVTTGAYSGINAWDINLNAGYGVGAVASLTTPIYDMTGAINPSLSFRRNQATAQNDGLRVYYNLDGSGNWVLLGSVNDPNGYNWYNNPFLNFGDAGWDGTTTGWEESRYYLLNVMALSASSTPFIQFRFDFESGFNGAPNDGVSIDDLCVKLPPPIDVGVFSVISPVAVEPAGQCTNITVTVRNYGSVNQNVFDVWYSIAGGPPVQATYNGLLIPGQSAQFTFPVCDTLPVGLFDFCSWTSLAGDGDSSNDTTCIEVLGIPVLTPTACDDFESGNLGYQTTTTNAPSAEWQLGTPAFGATTGANSGTNAWDINLNTGYGFNAYAELYTPIYDFASPTSINPYLTFWRNQSTPVNDGLRISYEVNSSGVWTLLGNVNDPNSLNWYNNAALNFGLPGWDGSTGGWVESRYYLEDLITINAANTLRFRFEFNSGFNGVPNDGVSIDDICVKQPGPDDVGVVAITEPFTNSPAGNQSNVVVSIRNFGSAPQSAFDVYYQIDGNTPVQATFGSTINPNQVIAFSMPQFTVPSGSFDFCAWTELAGDSDNSNDTTCKVSVGVPVIPLSYTSPFNDNFDGTNLGWSTTSVNPATIWELGLPNFGQTNSAFSAPNAWDVNLNTVYGPSASCDLYSPIFDLSNAVDAKLYFWRNHNTEQNWDGVRLEYSENGGPWTLLGAANQNPPCWVNWYNMPTINCSNQPAWAGATGGWVKTEANCLGQFDGDLVQFRFTFCSDASVQIDGFSIDNWNMSIPVPLTASPITINTNAINSNFIFPGQSVQFTSPISNPGTTPLTSVNATITISPIGQAPIVTYTDPIAYAPALAAQANLPHIFTQLWTAAPGVYEVCVITSEPNNGVDLNPFDDTTCIIISVFDTVTVTSANGYCNDFEGSQPQWVTANALNYNSDNSWEIGTPSQTIINGAFSGTNAYTIDLDSNYTNRDSSGLFTPVFTIDNSKCYKLKFMHKYDTEPFADGGTVEYSTDFAQTWNHLGFASGTPQPWFNTPFITALGGSPGLPGWSGLEANWVQAEQTAQFFSGTNVIFRFRFASDNTVNNYEGWAIDDVCFEELTVPCVVGIQDPEADGVMLGQNFPNPFNGTSTVEYVLPGAGQVKISITDIIGQEIAVPVDGQKEAGSHSFTINSRGLGSGIYYYTLEFDGKQITRKMIITE